MTLPILRARLRRALRDEDATAYRWTDAELDGHLERAVRELSVAAPLEAKTALTAAGGSRTLSLAGLSGLVAVEAVEYPVGQYPPTYVPFSRWASDLALLIDAVPASGATVAVYYGKMHTVDATSSTLPPALEEVAVTGAAAYAALAWASFAINRVNAGGADTWRSLYTWGQERLAAFGRALARHSKRNTVRVRRLYIAAGAPVNESVVGAPG